MSLGNPLSSHFTDVGILWTYCCSTAATLVRKQAPQYTLVILVVLPIFLIIFPIIGFVIMSKIVGCRRRRRKARDAVMIGASCRCVSGECVSSIWISLLADAWCCCVSFCCLRFREISPTSQSQNMHARHMFHHF